MNLRVTLAQRLDDLGTELLSLGRAVRAQLTLATEVVATGSDDAAAKITAGRRPLDETSTRLGWAILSVITLESPVAGDLRLLAGLLHINEHLGRMGGLCANLAKASRQLDRSGPPDRLRAILVEMAGEAALVVETALTCLERRDLDLAATLPDLDRPLDELNAEVFAEIDRTGGSGADLTWAVQAVLAARFLERLGDHAVDIGEQVHFIVTGEVLQFLPPKAARAGLDTAGPRRSRPRSRPDRSDAVPAILPYGSWPSPLAPELMATSGVGLSQVRLDGDDVLWAELRPTEAGRTCVVRATPDGTVADVLPEGANARTLVHEYGGGSYAVRDGVVVYAELADQRLRRIETGAGQGDEPVPITPDPATPRSVRYADMAFTPDGTRLYAVRERHPAEGEAVNDIVVLPVDGSAEPVAVAGGHDFCSTPRVSPDGTRLAWLTWDHPRMPWDGTELWTAPIQPDGTLGEATLVAGGPEESIFQPSWSPGGVLHFVSERTGWWNLYALRDGEAVNLAPVEAELGHPQWVFGMSTYGFLDDDRIAAVVNSRGRQDVALIEGGRITSLGLPYTAIPGPDLAAGPGRIATIAASAAEPSSVVVAGPDGSGRRVLRRSLSLEIEPGLIAEPEPIEFPTTGGATAYALYYPPANPDATGPDGELPPLLVNSHGGPTGQTYGGLSLGTLFWTSRGFGVVHVDYGGSTGYGRAYRERLKGNWGIVDVDDCVAAARFLAERGSADPARLAIRGGSAGGYTTLAALTFTDVFAAGTSFYGVADAAALAADTHKFESRYLDGLIGPWPEAEALYRERSPIHHTDHLSCPILLLQGLEDMVVPAAQAEQMVAALAAKGIPHAYIAFPGEQHGFRQVATIRRAYEAELAFYGQVLGFTPAGDIPPLELS